MTYAPPAADIARCPGPSMQDILKADQETAPAVLEEESFQDLNDEPVAVEPYTSREFHDREVEKMWRRVWQMACRVEQIPNVGDHIVYEIADDSLIVTRTSGTEIKAYFNACLHRGTRLRDEDGHVQAFRCPFHGFTWGLDGTLKGVPCRWDFPNLKDEDFRLPEAHVATWGGFVFINMNPQCEPLEEYLGEMVRHFEPWPLEQRYLTAHVSKVVHANWKVAQEAFMEAYHVLDTHPEIEACIGDWNAQYDVYNGGHSRLYNAMYVPSPRITQSGKPVPEQEIADLSAQVLGINGTVDVPEGMTARQVVAQQYRLILEKKTGADLSGYTTSEMLDLIQYFVFPNFFPWAGLGALLIYRFRPNGNDPDSCLMEIMLLMPRPENGECPPPAKHRHLGPDESWADATELGDIGPIFDQDTANMPRVQAGLKTTRKPSVTLSQYQEVRIRHMHHRLDQYLNAQN